MRRGEEEAEERGKEREEHPKYGRNQSKKEQGERGKGERVVWTLRVNTPLTDSGGSMWASQRIRP